MSSRTDDIVVVGGGPAGLAAAMLASTRGGGGRVRIIEDSPAVGGLWRSYDYGRHGQFDHGMHNFFESGITDIDDYFFGLLAPDERCVLEGPNRDLAGVFYRGHLQDNSPSIDLRRLDPAERRRCLTDAMSQAAIRAEAASPSAMDFARAQWGEVTTERYIKPIVERQFGVPAEDLAVGALGLTALRRMILLDEPEMLACIDDPAIRQRLAFPDQRRMPAQYTSGRRGFYPARPGLGRLVAAAAADFRRRGITIDTSSRVSKLTVTGGKVVSIDVTANAVTLTIPCAHLIWSAGLRPLAALSGVQWPTAGATIPRLVTLVNLLAREPLADKGLHYFYCYDSELSAFRVNCYRNFCRGAATEDGLTPYSIELLDVPLDAAAARARQEFVRFGLVSEHDAASLIIAGCESLGRAFPMPTLTNEAATDQVRRHLLDRRPANLHLVGAQATPGLFFQPEILRHLHSVISEAIH